MVTTPQETAEVEEAEAEEAEPEEVKALRPYHETQRVNPRVEPRSLLGVVGTPGQLPGQLLASSHLPESVQGGSWGSGGSP